MEGIIENLLNTCKGKVTKGEFAEIITGTSKSLTDIVTQKLAHSKLVDMLPLCKAIISSTNTEKLEEWYPKYKKENVGSVDISQLTLFQYSWQMYIEIILRSENSFSSDFLQFSFSTVHTLLANDEMEYNKWEQLSNLLPEVAWYNSWDKCKRLRKAAKQRSLSIDFSRKNKDGK